MGGRLYGEVAFVTGAHSGVGKFVAERLMKDGYKVYGTSRKVIPGGEGMCLNRNPEGCGFIQLIYMDVCNEDSIKEAINYIIEKEGEIGILVNNAGIVSAGSVEDTSSAEAHQQLETNFFGAHRVLRQVLPVMRRQKRGLIINISSFCGIVTLPYQSMYCASKYALEAMTEALRMEVKPLGIRVVAIEPGDMKTGNTSNRTFAAASENSVYMDWFLKSMSIVAKDEQGGPEPIGVAKAVAMLANRKNPPAKLVVGLQYKLLAAIIKFAPVKLRLYAISRMYGQPIKDKRFMDSRAGKENRGNE